MELELSGRCALVLAGGGGLGGGVARALAAEGAKVAVADVAESAAIATAAAIRERGGEGVGFACDLADLQSIRWLIDRVRERLGDPDILINITGGPPPTTAGGVDPDQWTAHFDSMVKSVIYVTDLVLPSMRARRWGRVITSTSSGVVTPIPNLGISNVLRMSLLGWSKTLAREVGLDGVTVNVVVPGRISTRRIVRLDEARAARERRPVEEIVRESHESIPLQRYGTVEEYAAVVAFLASAKASYITGSVIRVDGGLIPSV